MNKTGLRIGTILVLLVLGVWAFYWEPSSFRIKKYPLAIENLKLGSTYRIAVMADIHTGSAYQSLERLEKIVESVNKQDVDLILIAGDLMAHHKGRGRHVPPNEITRRLGKLRARDGVFGVLGNHDWWYDPKEITREMEANGIPMLDEKIITIKDKFQLMGIGDYTEGSPNPEQIMFGAKADLPILAFTHNPDIFPRISNKVLLTVAGHTHGGQVWFPILGRLIVPSDYGSRYGAGLIVENGHKLFVSTGIGTSILPVRFFVPPEVSILELN